MRSLSAVLTCAALVLTAPALAAARGGSGGDDTGDGYEVGVEVVLTGDGAPGDGGSYTVSIPPICWWESVSTSFIEGAPVDGTDPVAFYEWFQEVRPFLSGHAAIGQLAFPDTPEFLEAIALEESGVDVTWYTIGGPEPLECSPHVEQLSDYYGGGEAGVMYSWFVTGEEPAPAVDPETLAIEAREHMVIAEPEVDRNPKLADSLDGATFVNVNTWFWVVDPEMVGGSGGTRTIRADVVGTDVWAEVTATTDGLSIASPNGSRQCDPELAQQAWAPGAADTGGCSVQFTRASVAYPGGYPVTAATEWTASWEGQEQDGSTVGGDLDPLRRESTVNVPVAEVQTIVKRAR
ncbi:hypothetical protein [Jiangella muralis]|uniref:hypothetical protein n=1 Tax=Jiangella muralis TaxID=702383 RepID=UPI0012F8D9BC|nr:hypothetical protein [Jiangella muralis]